MFIKLLIISVIFIGIAVAGLGIGILLKQHGRFPEFHVGKNAEMRKRGISCARKTDLGCTVSFDNQRCSDCTGDESRNL